jgi:hypothetical protein
MRDKLSHNTEPGAPRCLTMGGGMGGRARTAKTTTAPLTAKCKC